MPEINTILVTGGAGYVGAVLVPKLLTAGYRVKVLDLYLYGRDVFDGIADRTHLIEVKGDIRDRTLLAREIPGSDAVIHLACISNDPSAELDPQLTRSINVDAFVPLLELCRNQNVARFILASSSSVYGISDAPNVTEDHPRIPVPEYNRSKAYCEDQLIRFGSDDFAVVAVRPATVSRNGPDCRCKRSRGIGCS